MNQRIEQIEKLAERAREQCVTLQPGETFTMVMDDSHLRTDLEVTSAIMALPPGYLAAMAEVCESLGIAEDTRDVTDATDRREHQKFGLCWRTSTTEGLIDWGADNIADSPTLAALARLRELEPKKEGNG